MARNNEMMEALTAIAIDKGISEEIMLEALANALVTAYKRLPRAAERERKYEEYAGREGDIVTGIIQQTDARYTLLDLGRVEALLPQAEQVPGDRYDHGSRMKAYICLLYTSDA